MSGDPRVEAARTFCTLAEASRSAQAKRETDDLAFQVPELQWPEAIRTAWAGGTINGVYTPPRPMLSISKIDQPVQLVLNQERGAHLGVVVHPLTADADDDTAEVLQDIYRGIERDSFADLARSWAFERAVKCGFGVYRLRTEYVEADLDGPGLFDQRIVIDRILDQRCVLLDPAAQQPDWSDGQKAIIYEVMPLDRYQREYPDSTLASFEGVDWADDDRLGWITSEEGQRTVRVAEYFYVEFQDVEKTFGGQTRTVRQPVVHWCKVNGVEVLDEAILPGRYIPIVPVLGRELQPFDADRRFVGVIGPAKDPQRVLNFEVSSAVEKDALATKAPWLVAEGQEEGHEAEFELSTTRNLSMIRYKPTSLNGVAVERPSRIQSSVDLSSSLLLIEQANEAIYATTFTNAPSLGKLDSRAISGRAKLADRDQADQSNSHYLDNLARAIRHEARIVLGWLPYYYDRPGRVVTTVDDEAKKSTVMVNQPFVRDPHGRPQPAPAGVASPSPVKQYDLTKGVYGVSVTVGKSQASRLAAGSDGLGAILQSAPDTLPILGPIYLKYQDFPGHEQAAEALKRAFPQFHQGEDADADPTQLQAKLAHATQMLDQAKQEMDAMKQALETKQVEAQGKIAAVQAADQGQAQIEAMSQQFALKKLAMQADIDEMLAKLEGAIKLKLQDDQQQHLMAMAAAEAERADRGARASAHHEAVMGARSHEQHMVAGEVAHEQAETSAERQAERDATVTAAQGDGDDGA